MWQCVRWYGEVHVVPLGDKRFHTVPTCWCGPRYERTLKCRIPYRHGGIGANLVTHNAIAVSR